MRTTIPEGIKAEVLSRSNNRCCVCQVPFVQIHHIDCDPTNNDMDNLAPLCPNCHSQVHSKSMLTTNLTAPRLKVLRDRWYSYCENRKEGSCISASALLKLKVLVNSSGSADHGWKKMFSTVDPSYAGMSREEIMNRVFSTSNRDDLVAALETVKSMYGRLGDPPLLQKFQAVCNAFGIGYDELL
jgi:hypothetical protein